MNRTLLEHLRALGLEEGDVVLVHSSLSALGYVEGGADAVIDTLLAAIGPDGTLLMPSHSKPFSHPESYVFSLRGTRTHVGRIPETLRTRAGVVRSIHPTHSVSATGPLAAELTQRHRLDETPVGPHSPYRLLPQYGGKILMLGCGLNPNTFLHGVEEIAHAPYGLAREKRVYQLEIDGVRSSRAYYPHDFTGLAQQYRRLAQVMDAQTLRRGPLLAGEGFLMRAQDALDAALAAMARDPYYFVDRTTEG